MASKIAIVNSSSFGRIFPEHIEKLRKIGQVERFDLPKDIKGKELAEKLMGFSIIIASVTAQYDKEFFDYKDNTLLISRHGIGYNNIDIKAATEKGTLVTKVEAEVEREAVAENAIALLMDTIRQTSKAAKKAREGKWSERAKFIGYEIKDKTVGVIGLGNIGSRVGEILKNGFNCKLIAYDPNLSNEEIINKGAEPVTLERLLKESDIISLNACITKESYHLISGEEFSMMKKGVFIVNTARGELMDEKELLRALDDGIIGGMGLDVIEGEPINEEHPLFKYENVVITPHTSAYTYECLKGMGDKVISDVERVLANEKPDNLINIGAFIDK
ncbi:D-isomer specific 2-hydroxyacid dehydrogenase family protein [Clostridium sp. AL.422]|uniref:D-isomer specific 2-hydroxyacid dehydrogenase family protein n=1 Tax=Clostridium TaxID=1485 RepID=UPI00293DD731|nr:MULTISPECIES: D-isomer specific 2-hydroxyacid dehydrogenase family protein [unclassified Clostridium]MDV4149900.1 D-isomer specific 2-hydroxyacid dehydrogenase family protein [Clostridium sp. AL.422]